MIRITKMSEKFYGVKISTDDEREMEEIKIFAAEGSPIIMVHDLEDLVEINIDPSEVEMIER